MKLRLGNYSFFINIQHSVRPERKPKKPYPGRICDVCGELVKGGEKALHLQEYHPEYAFTFGTPRGSCSRYYWCSTCGITCGGVVGVVRHYQEHHPEKIMEMDNEQRRTATTSDPG